MIWMRGTFSPAADQLDEFCVEVRAFYPVDGDGGVAIMGEMASLDRVFRDLDRAGNGRSKCYERRSGPYYRYAEDGLQATRAIGVILSQNGIWGTR